MIQKLLEERKLPALMKMNDGTPVTAENWNARRRELIDVLETMEYGRFPKKCGETTWKVVSTGESSAGKATKSRVEITVPMPDGASFTFPVTVSIPNTATADAPKPAFVYIFFAFLWYYPEEELVDNDVTVAEMWMNDVAWDTDEHLEKMAAHFSKDGQRGPDTTGKIGLWAFAASCVLDYLLSLDCVDKNRVGVIGHSRLGKTALWAGVNDERFTHVFSNDSGCSGAAITRQKVGEDFPAICRRFPYWFCENMKEISGTVEDSENAPFDQHYLLAAVAPRKLYVASAEKDQWADPVSEYLCCAAASEAWEANGVTGFVHPDRLPENWDRFADGNVAYHLRPGTHFLSRHDWVRYCDFIRG